MRNSHAVFDGHASVPATPKRGGIVKPLRMSRSRLPSIWLSMVSTSAHSRLPRRASIISRVKPRSL